MTSSCYPDNDVYCHLVLPLRLLLLLRSSQRVPEDPDLPALQHDLLLHLLQLKVNIHQDRGIDTSSVLDESAKSSLDGYSDPRAGSVGLGAGVVPSPAAATAVMACEAMVSISSRSSWVKSSSSPNGSSKAATTSWSRPRRRLVGGQFILRGTQRSKTESG
ncbi:hypothetical protein EYF80_044679 [Liparis tanakae]|uniref:Uncharacterized protein n=1 Tax=Liparis tanakae TaxID=230148 RepID=A0A4Z2FW54_9TELE|nr:hypothetical protein EYF80_044679 [Liparis tanakae]